MCLAIWKPEGALIEKWELRNGFCNNTDGAGFAYAKDGKLITLKGFFKFKAFWHAYQKACDYPMVIHFRQVTHGARNEANCHPFSLCSGEYALIHNGILPIDTDSDKTKSDTAHFAECVLTPMLQGVAFDEPALKFLVELAIGDYNKLVILRNDGEASIFNEDKGHWHNGSWFSNYGYSYDVESSYGNRQSCYGFGAQSWFPSKGTLKAHNLLKDKEPNKWNIQTDDSLMDPQTGDNLGKLDNGIGDWEPSYPVMSEEEVELAREEETDVNAFIEKENDRLAKESIPVNIFDAKYPKAQLPIQRETGEELNSYLARLLNYHDNHGNKDTADLAATIKRLEHQHKEKLARLVEQEAMEEMNEENNRHLNEYYSA